MKKLIGHTAWLMVAAVAGGVIATSAQAQQAAVDESRPAGALEAMEPGASLRVYEVGEDMRRLPRLVEGQTPNVSRRIDVIDLTNDDFGLEDKFIAEVDAYLTIDQPGQYTFRLTSDDGSVLMIGDKVAVDHDGLHSANPPKEESIELPAGRHRLKLRMFDQTVDARLRLQWKTPGSDQFVLVPKEALSTEADQVRVTSPGQKKVITPEDDRRPGDGRPVAGVHPGYDLVHIRTEGFEPKVGGIDFLSDGRLVICTWDRVGAVYIIDGVTSGKAINLNEVKIRKFAEGLAEPLGIRVVDDQIYVLQKQELTLLVDHDNDGVADEYRSICDGWEVTDNFHEFAFGLVHKDGKFYANLAVAINPGGSNTVPQKGDRGTVIEIDPQTGTFRHFAQGLRTPNGIGLGPDDDIFVLDNQGDWLPSSKLLHVQDGHFYGAHKKPDHSWADREAQPPVLWLPQGEIGNSPSEPALITDGPYKGQLLHGDVTHGGVKRDFIEKIGGQWQGAVFRFAQGLEAGVNRIRFGPDGCLYVGMLGSAGNWGHEGKKFGLQKLAPNGHVPFEMLAVRAMTDGLEIEFTQPLKENTGWDPGDYEVRQWRYEPKATYGGPKLDEKRLEVLAASVSEDRRRVFLKLDGMKAGHVVYVRLMGSIRNEADEWPWATEAWYTLNRIPADRPGVVREPPAQNVLTDAERQEGWRLLFNGRDLDGWRKYRGGEITGGWEVVDGALTRTGNGGDIVTAEQFGDFELSLQWKVSPGGNSGIFYRAGEEGQAVWQTAAEMQVLDNARHRDGQDAKTSAGSLYAMIAPSEKVVNPAGTWNDVRIVARGPKVEHWLNGRKIVEYEVGTPAWKTLVAGSKFASLPRFGTLPKGHIALQDHGDLVAFRNIKIKPLD